MCLCVARIHKKCGFELHRWLLLTLCNERQFPRICATKELEAASSNNPHTIFIAMALHHRIRMNGVRGRNANRNIGMFEWRDTLFACVCDYDIVM